MTDKQARMFGRFLAGCLICGLLGSVACARLGSKRSASNRDGVSASFAENGPMNSGLMPPDDGMGPPPPEDASPGAFPGDPSSAPMGSAARAENGVQMRAEMIRELKLSRRQTKALERIEEENPGDDPGARFIVMSELKKILTKDQLKAFDTLERSAPPM